MAIHLEQLEHQEKAVQALLSAFPQIDDYTDDPDKNYVYANPILQGRGNESQFIDCKMETGTGKTYVYTRMMYELHKARGLNKFILVVPTLAIKEGTKSFITSDYAKQHFSVSFPNVNIEFLQIQSGDFSSKKGKRKIFPSSLSSFCEGTRNEKNTIYCLLVNTQMLQAKGMNTNDYDQTLIGGYSHPIEALRLTRPVVMIDEPHKVKRSSKGYQAIQAVEPQMILRFGATFPEIEKGKDKGGKDYYRGTPQVDLNAVESFNQGLVKEIDVLYPTFSTANEKKYKVKAVNVKSVTFTRENREFEVKINENLADIDPAFEGSIEYLGGKNKELSNGLELNTGMELLASTWSNSYQEMLLKQALDEHFVKERENFLQDGNAPRVKTISLFFIDSIASYREKDGWLREKFLELLKKKLSEEIKEIQPKITESTRAHQYLSYLEATMKEIEVAHGGYFAEDKGTGDEAIRQEVEDILKNKEKMLKFQNEDDTWNTRRFLFSKWTLREGWDNPNVFVICKLRTSGSEISKIQEVGRGLRLPVDEHGNRLSKKPFSLSYIIGFDEKEFAEKLKNEVNSDVKLVLNSEKLSEEMIAVIIKARNLTSEDLLDELDEKDIIRASGKFKEGGYEKLLAEYPELSEARLKQGKIRDNRKESTPKIKLNKENWQKIKTLWLELSKRRMLSFERLNEVDMQELLDKMFVSSAFVVETMEVVRQSSSVQEGQFVMSETVEGYHVPTELSTLSYGEFLKQLHKQTSLPIQKIQQSVANVLKTFASEGQSKKEINAYLNHRTLQNLVKSYKDTFQELFVQKYEYHALDYLADTSVIKNDEFVDEIAQGAIGNFVDTTFDEPSYFEKYLYEKPIAYDSELEREVEKILPKKVTVFGKIPTRAIKVPTYTGGTTTPDFIYYVENEEASNLTLLVETKPESLREPEKVAVGAQEKMFQSMGGVEWKLANSVTDVHEALKKLT